MNLVKNVLILGRRRPSTRTTSTRTRTTTPLQRDQILRCRRWCYRKQTLCVFRGLCVFKVGSIYNLEVCLFAPLGHLCTHSATPLWPQTQSKNNYQVVGEGFSIQNWNSGNIEARYFLGLKDFWNRKSEWMSYNFHGLGLDQGLTCSSSCT